MHWIVFAVASSTWFCNQVDTQFQVMHDLLSKMNCEGVDELKRVVSDYWEENHNHCSAKERRDLK